MPDNDMGKGPLSQGGGSLVNIDIKHISEVWKMSEEDTLKNIIELAQKMLKERAK